MNRKQTVATRLPNAVRERLERVAREDRRTLSTTTLMAIEAGLPELEREVLGDEYAAQQAAKPAQEVTP